MKSKKATVLNSFGPFLLALGAFLIFRWALFEPFVIPSGSMIPTLLVHDHIAVAKWPYGWRWPFSQKWWQGPHAPSRFEVIVFKSVENPDIYMIKRVIGLPGDEIQIEKDGRIFINKVEVARRPANEILFEEKDLESELDDVDFYFEGDKSPHIIMLKKSAFHFESQNYKVPEGHLFVMGDNRDSSNDGRFWGYLPFENLVGRAQFVWLSCSETLSETQNLCDPHFIRWQRLFSPIQ